jgi:hypothetical protein
MVNPPNGAVLRDGMPEASNGTRRKRIAQGSVAAPRCAGNPSCESVRPG